MVFDMDNKNEEVMPEKLEDLLKAGYKLIDVREQDEWDAGHHSEAEHIPMGTIPENIENFSTAENYIIICRSGGRSGRVCTFLEKEGINSFNLNGGMNKLSLTSEKIIDLHDNIGTVI